MSRRAMSMPRVSATASIPPPRTKDYLVMLRTSQHDIPIFNHRDEHYATDVAEQLKPSGLLVTEAIAALGIKPEPCFRVSIVTFDLGRVVGSKVVKEFS